MGKLARPRTCACRTERTPHPMQPARSTKQDSTALPASHSPLSRRLPRRRWLWRQGLVVAALVAGGTASAAQASPPTRIAVTVRGLPGGVRPAVVVKGRRFQRVITSSHVVIRVPRGGAYRLEEHTLR